MLSPQEMMKNINRLSDTELILLILGSRMVEPAGDPIGHEIGRRLAMRLMQVDIMQKEAAEAKKAAKEEDDELY